MLERVSINEELSYEKLSQEEMDRRGILGRLYGPCATIISPTRNGRFYSEELWEKVFDNAIMKEKFERGGVFGECGHPVDREEVDIEKIALCMPQPPKRNSNGQLIAMFDILATPCGKILKTLCDYGYKIGISSRGTGDTYTNEDGNESVDPDTYDCECFDAVLIPAVKEATLKLAESLSKEKSFKKALAESLNSASDSDRKLMTETLSNLHISYSNINESVDESGSKEVSEKVVEADAEATNDGDELVNQLQEALKREKALQEQITSLQEKLSVSYAKEVRLEERMTKLRRSVINLRGSKERADALEVKVNSLVEEINKKDAQIRRRETVIQTKEALNEQLRKSGEVVESDNKALKENAQQMISTVKDLKGQVTKLNESLNAKDAEHTREVNSLKESIQDLKKDSALKNAEYNKKLGKSNELVEKYRKIAQSAVNKYIDSQARVIGVSSSEIKNKLTENYSFQDIDKVVEDLRNYKLNVSKLPFDVSRKTNNKSNVKMKVTESYEPIFGGERLDDDVDEQLMNLIK